MSRTNNSPNVSSGSGAPTTVPTKIGDIYVDTVGGKVYIATNVNASTDWKILN